MTAGGSEVLFSLAGDDLRMTDLHIEANSIFRVFGVSSTNTLIERVEAEGYGYSNSAQLAGYGVYIGPTATNSFVVDSHFHTFYGYAMFGGSPIQSALIGTIADDIQRRRRRRSHSRRQGQWR